MSYLANKRGYTLTELMVALSIIGVVAMIAVPSYLSFLPHLRLNSASRDLLSDLRLARSLAVSQNQRHYLFFDAANDWYEIRRSSDDVRVRSRADYRDSNQGHMGIDMVSIKDKNNTPITTIEFDFNGAAVIGKNGNSDNMPVTITIQRSAGTIETKTINITRLGHANAN